MEWKRIVRYMYEYENDRKVRNTGFIRFDLSDRVCKAYIHGKGIHAEDICNIYAFYESDDAIIRIPLGYVRMRNGKLDGYVEMDPAHVGSTDIPFERIVGIMIGENRERRYLAFLRNERAVGGMQDASNVPEHMPQERAESAPGNERRDMVGPDLPEDAKREMPERDSREGAEAASREPEVPENEHGEMPEPSSREGAKAASSVPSSRENAGTASREPENERGGISEPYLSENMQREMPERDSREGAGIASHEPDSQESEEAASPEPEEQGADPAERMTSEEEDTGTENIEMMADLPPETEEIVSEEFDYRRIGPRDLGILRRQDRHLTNNSFLLHGYYNYRHLLLSEDGDQYILGVPGVYMEREKRAASMFGFPQFMEAEEYGIPVPMEAREHKAVFGYW